MRRRAIRRQEYVQAPQQLVVGESSAISVWTRTCADKLFPEQTEKSIFRSDMDEIEFALRNDTLLDLDANENQPAAEEIAKQVVGRTEAAAQPKGPYQTHRLARFIVELILTAPA